MKKKKKTRREVEVVENAEANFRRIYKERIVMWATQCSQQTASKGVITRILGHSDVGTSTPCRVSVHSHWDTAMAMTSRVRIFFRWRHTPMDWRTARRASSVCFFSSSLNKLAPVDNSRWLMDVLTSWFVWWKFLLVCVCGFFFIFVLWKKNYRITDASFTLPFAI